MQRGGYSYQLNKVADLSTVFRSGLYQAYVPYRIGRKFYQLVVVNGIIFMVSQDDFSVKVLTLNAQTQLNPLAKRINAFMAARYVVFADFPNRPIIIDNG